MLAGELTGNFIDSGLGGASIAPKKRVEPEAYELIPYAPEQGIFCGLAGNLNPRSGKFLPLIRESRSRLLFCPTNPILPPAPAPAFPSPAMQPSAKASSNPPCSSGESNANPRAPCPASARPARSRSTTSAAVHGCRGLQKPEVLADLAGLPAFALVRFARVPQICHFT
jgi:hypothetical protein